MVEDLTVRDVMTRAFVGVSESDTVRDAADLLLKEGESIIAVLHGGKPVGMVSERQLLASVLDDEPPDSTRVDAVMQRPPQTLQPDQNIADAAVILADVDTDHLFVTDGDDLLGVLSENDLITAVTSMLSTERDAFEEFARADAFGEGPEADMSLQSVCEVCGTLKADLNNVNGQLICTDCHSV